MSNAFSAPRFWRISSSTPRVSSLVVEDRELHVEDRRFFRAGASPRRARAADGGAPARARARRGSASISARNSLVRDDAVADVGHLPAQEVHVADDDAGRGGDPAGAVAPLALPELVGDERRDRVDAPARRRRRRRAAAASTPHSAASIMTPMMLLPFTSMSSRTMVISLLNLAASLHDLRRGPGVQAVLVDDLHGAFDHQRTTEKRAKRAISTSASLPAFHAAVDADEHDRDQRTRPTSTTPSSVACRPDARAPSASGSATPRDGRRGARDVRRPVTEHAGSPRRRRDARARASSPTRSPHDAQREMAGVVQHEKDARRPRAAARRGRTRAARRASRTAASPPRRAGRRRCRAGRRAPCGSARCARAARREARHARARRRRPRPGTGAR